MQSLYNLIQSLAKEEKRLYTLHGRKAKFSKIYEAYVQAESFDKELDKQVYRQHYANSSRAYYSMQKNALLDDLLAVLLEFSNSSRDDFSLTRLRAKYEILTFKGMYDLAKQFARQSLELVRKSNRIREYVAVLEDYREILAQIEDALPEETEQIEQELLDAKNTLKLFNELTEARHQIAKLYQESKEISDSYNSNFQEAQDILRRTTAQQSFIRHTVCLKAYWDLVFVYGSCFEDKYQLHARLVEMEKSVPKERNNFPNRLHLINLLIESSMDCGDFLLINGLIYKMEKEFTFWEGELTEESFPRFLELSAIYYFYENDLPLSQRKLYDLLKYKALPADLQRRAYHHLIAVLIAANLSGTASEVLLEMYSKLPAEREKTQVKLYELVIAVEQNRKEEAAGCLHGLLANLKKSPNKVLAKSIKAFLLQLRTFLEREAEIYEPISALETGWRELFKPNLWLKAKFDNYFYYNSILNYWQQHKQVLNV